MENLRIGTAGELVAAADLVMRGFQVFRSVSNTNSCDLIAMHGNTLYRVEVKTGKRKKTDGPRGINRYSRPKSGNWTHCDFIAVVFDGRIVRYRPSMWVGSVLPECLQALLVTNGVLA